MKVLKDLVHASGELYRLVISRESYGKIYYVIQDSKIVPYDEALDYAMKQLEAALVEAGGVLYVSPQVN
jgi:hypothetical protein